MRSLFNKVLVWVACSALLLLGSAADFQEQPMIGSSTAVAGQAKSQEGPARVFESVLPEIKKKTRVPVLLPSDLPEGAREAKCATGEAAILFIWTEKNARPTETPLSWVISPAR